MADSASIGRDWQDDRAELPPGSHGRRRLSLLTRCARRAARGDSISPTLSASVSLSIIKISPVLAAHHRGARRGVDFLILPRPIMPQLIARSQAEGRNINALLNRLMLKSSSRYSHLDLGLGQDLETRCTKLSFAKFWGTLFFEGYQNILRLQP